MAEPIFSSGLSKGVDLGRSDIVKGIGFGRAGDNGKRRAFSRFEFQIHSIGKIYAKVHQTVCAFISSE